MVPLAVGDYAIGDGVLVERKTVGDLHRSVVRGRFWFQVGRLRRAGPVPYLLVEGADLDDGTLTPTAVRGCLVAAVDLGVRLIRSSDPADSALWLHRLAFRHGERPPRRDRPLVVQSRKEPSPEAVLAAVPGISHRSAVALLERFGSLQSVLDAGQDQWLTVKGIGAKRASALERTLTAARR
jgi:Fanconi anemia group M protein